MLNLMKLSPQSFKQSWKHIVIVSLVIIYIVINVFRIGGDPFVINLNSNIVYPLAIGITGMALMLWQKLGTIGKNRLLWSGLAFGWALWTIAEIWWGIAGLIYQEVPYPSGADFFWLVGYIPMYIALWERSRSLPKPNNPLQIAGIWFSILFSIGWTIYFVIIPILRDSEATTLLENILGITYPLADLFLLIMVLRIFFTFRHGMYGRAWGWLSTGFIFVSLADLIFAYATTVGLYYPDRQANLISTMGVEVPYTLGYLFWLVGLAYVQTIQKSHQMRQETPAPLALVPNTHILVFTKEDDSVTSVSLNYWRVYQREFVLGKKLAEVIECSPEKMESFLSDIKSKEILTEQTISVQTRFGHQTVLISGASEAIVHKGCSGAILLLRLYTEDYYLDDLLSDFQDRTVHSLLEKTGTQVKEEEDIKHLLAHYHLAFISAFYNRVFSEGGSIMADAFITELQSVMESRGWQVGIRSDNLLDVSAISLSETREALPVLSESAKQFVVQITDEIVTNSIIQKVQSFFDECTLKNIAYFEKAKPAQF
jgi:hypothetical protein